MLLVVARLASAGEIRGRQRLRRSHVSRNAVMHDRRLSGAVELVPAAGTDGLSLQLLRPSGTPSSRAVEVVVLTLASTAGGLSALLLASVLLAPRAVHHLRASGRGAGCSGLPRAHALASTLNGWANRRPSHHATRRKRPTPLGSGRPAALPVSPPGPRRPRSRLSQRRCPGGGKVRAVGPTTPTPPRRSSGADAAGTHRQTL